MEEKQRLPKEIQGQTNITPLRSGERGGLGTIYKALHIIENKTKIIKQLQFDEHKEEDIKMAKREAKILIKCDHPNIVKYYHAFETNEAFVLIMEYCERGSLSKFIKEQITLNTFPIKEQIVSKQLKMGLEGLQQLHEIKQIHSGIKPDNLFIAENDILKIGKLISCLEIEPNESQQSSKSTLQQRAPQILPEKPFINFKAADIWSLGKSILQTMLNFEKLPNEFHNTLNQEILKEHLSTEQSESLIKIIGKMLVHDQDKRASAEQLLKEEYFRFKKPPEVQGYKNIIPLENASVGGFGNIYKALHCDLNKTFIIKELLFTNQNVDFEQAKRESQILIKLSDHPNVVTYRDSYETKEGIYIIMEQCQKGDMLKFINDQIYQNKFPIDEKIVKKYLQMALEGLKHIHKNEIMHRDIKPSNIFLTENDVLKIGDFGIAKAKVKYAKTVQGNDPNYIWTAPEMGWGEYTNKVDIWSLGMSFLQMMLSMQFVKDFYLGRQFSQIKNYLTIHQSNELINIIEKMLIVKEQNRSLANDLLKEAYFAGQKEIEEKKKIDHEFKEVKPSQMKEQITNELNKTEIKIEAEKMENTVEKAEKNSEKIMIEDSKKDNK